jgi:hypothetical protein
MPFYQKPEKLSMFILEAWGCAPIAPLRKESFLATEGAFR